MARDSLVLKIDDDLMTSVKQYSEEKGVSVNRLANELFLGLMSTESQVGTELRQKIEERISRPAGRPGVDRAAVLEKQEEIRQRRLREKIEHAQEVHDRKVALRERAHEQKVELEKLRQAERLKLVEQKIELEKLRREGRRPPQATAQPLEVMARQDPPCEACAMPKSECECPSDG